MTIELTGAVPATRANPVGEASPLPSIATASKSSSPIANIHSEIADAASASAEKKVSPTGQLQINVDPQTSQVVIQIVNGNTIEIIRKIPAEEVVEFAHSLDSMTGNLIKAKA
jgi:uncharacterized FlaG/YvyC family protein